MDDESMVSALTCAGGADNIKNNQVINVSFNIPLQRLNLVLFYHRNEGYSKHTSIFPVRGGLKVVHSDWLLFAGAVFSLCSYYSRPRAQFVSISGPHGR